MRPCSHTLETHTDEPQACTLKSNMDELRMSRTHTGRRDEPNRVMPGTQAPAHSGPGPEQPRKHSSQGGAREGTTPEPTQETDPRMHGQSRCVAGSSSCSQHNARPCTLHAIPHSAGGRRTKGVHVCQAPRAALERAHPEGPRLTRPCRQGKRTQLRLEGHVARGGREWCPG